MFTVQYRKQIEINTDPQRRCYNGCHFSSILEWTKWKDVCTYNDKLVAESAMKSFSDINPHQEYRIIIKPKNTLVEK